MKNLKTPTPCKHPDTGKWGCDYEEVVDGKIKRRRRHYIHTSKKAAEARCTRIFNEQNPKVRKNIKTLTNAQQNEAIWAFEELGKFDVHQNSLRSAVEFYVENYKESGETRLTAEVVDDWLKERKQHLQPSSYAPLNSRLEKFKERFPIKIGEIESKELIGFIERYCS